MGLFDKVKNFVETSIEISKQINEALHTNEEKKIIKQNEEVKINTPLDETKNNPNNFEDINKLEDMEEQKTQECSKNKSKKKEKMNNDDMITQQDNETIRIYLGDWLFNAGIVGFIRILEFNDKKNNITIGDNYLSFDKDILKDFHEDYFSFAYNKANTFNDKIQRLNNLLSSQDSNDKDIKEYIKNITGGKTIKNDEQISLILSQSKVLNDWKKTAESLINELPNHWDRCKDLYVKYFLQSFYDGKSIFNVIVTTSIKEKFKKDFITPFFDTKASKKKVQYCKVCNERAAKKDTFFDEGVFKLTGTSSNEYKNFYWDLVPNTHLCGICELIYLCTFAGFSNLKSIGEFKKFLFVNLDTTIDDLYKTNRMLEDFVLSSRENPLRYTIHNILLDYEQKRSKWTLGNILFVEFNVENPPYQIKHFHIPKHIAELFSEKNKKYFNSLEGFYYKDNKETINVLAKSIDIILEGKSLYYFLNKVIRDYIAKKHHHINGIFNLSIIQILLKTYKNGRKDMDEEKVTKKMWSLYYEGINIARELKSKGSENKIDGIAYRMLSSLRVRDIKTFYDTLLRLYMNLNKEVPATFIEALSPDSILDSEAIGYAFITGFLGKEYSDNKDKGGQNNG